MEITVSFSTQASSIGFQCSSCQLGSPSGTGFSVNSSEWHPFSATRFTSAAVSSGDHSIGSAAGMNRPG